ncbi:hypothetical protein RJ639_038002 [Escallonia herrerae]|uniref:Uncharacterized protein n=1 Tax=Escallonia herrerae TaxID=1293975 RepID=A0AA88WJ71_9ASTE|nr:hypothetical protein RJ639_038002 [Escallonia herrerae]
MMMMKFSPKYHNHKKPKRSNRCSLPGTVGAFCQKPGCLSLSYPCLIQAHSRFRQSIRTQAAPERESRKCRSRERETERLSENGGWGAGVDGGGAVLAADAGVVVSDSREEESGEVQ